MAKSEADSCQSVSVSLPKRYVEYFKSNNLSISRLVRVAIEIERTREFARAVLTPLTLMGLSYMLTMLSNVLLVGASRFLSLGFGMGLFLVALCLLTAAVRQQWRISKYTYDMPLFRRV